MAKERIFGLQRNVFFAGLTSFFNDFSSEMIVSIFPAFFETVLKSGAASLGLAEGIADAVANFIKIYSGRLSDQVGRRKIFAVGGYSLSTLTRPFYLIASRVDHVIGLRVVDRIGKGLRDAPRDALISLSASKEELGRSFGYHRAMDTAGAVVGPLVAYLILRTYPQQFHFIFSTSFFIGILGVISFLLVREVKGVFSKKSGLAPPVFFSRPFKWYLTSALVLSAGTLPTAVLLLRTQDRGLTIADIPLFYMLYNIVYAAGSSAAGTLADKKGERMVITLGYVCLILSYAVLGYSAGIVALLVGFVLLGLFSALTDSVMRSLVARLTSTEQRGAAYGWLNGFAGLGTLIAGVGGGYTWQAYGPATALGVGVGIVVLGLVIFLRIKTI